MRKFKNSVSIGGAALVMAASSWSFGASGTWISTSASPGVWSDSGNWQSGTIAGFPSGGVMPSPAETATFGDTATQRNVLWDDGRTLNSVNFTNTSGNYALTPASAGNALYLFATGGGSHITSSGIGTNITNSVNGRIILKTSDGRLANNAGNPTNTLSIGGTVEYGITGTITLPLGGTNTGANTISAVISNGTATTLNISKINSAQGNGTWILSGANTYNGTTMARQGTLIAGADAPSDATVAGAFGKANSTITVGPPVQVLRWGQPRYWRASATRAIRSAATSRLRR